MKYIILLGLALSAAGCAHVPATFNQSGRSQPFNTHETSSLTAPTAASFGSKGPTMFFSLSPDSLPVADTNVAAHFTNDVQYVTNRLASMVKGIMLDDGYQLAGAGWPNASTVIYAHTNGLLIGIWTLVTCPTTNGTENSFYVETNKQVWWNYFSNMVAQGYDEIKLDDSYGTNSLGIGYKMQDTLQWMRTTIRTLAAQTGRMVAVSMKNEADPYATWFSDGFTHWDGGAGIPDAAFPGTWDVTSGFNFQAIFAGRSASLNFCGNGNFPFFPELGDFSLDTGSPNLPELRGALSMLAIGPLRTFPAMTNSTILESCLTNEYFKAIYSDPAGIPGYRVFQNSTDPQEEEIWIRRLANGDRAFAFYNPDTTKVGAVTLTVRSSQLGYAPGTPFVVLDVWAQTNAIFTNSFTFTVPSQSGALFHVLRALKGS